MKRLRIPRGQLETMRAHVEACRPLEACGLLAGKAWAVQKAIPVRNQAESAVRFRMDPREQLRAFEWIDDNGLELVGTFHSHPNGPDRPSPTDVAEATYPVAHLIWSGSEANWIVKGYWIEGSSVTEVGLDIAEGE